MTIVGPLDSEQRRKRIDEIMQNIGNADVAKSITRVLDEMVGGNAKISVAALVDESGQPLACSSRSDGELVHQLGLTLAPILVVFRSMRIGQPGFTSKAAESLGDPMGIRLTLGDKSYLGALPVDQDHRTVYVMGLGDDRFVINDGLWAAAFRQARTAIWPRIQPSDAGGAPRIVAKN